MYYIYIHIGKNIVELSEPFAKKEKKTTHSANERKLFSGDKYLDLPFGDGRMDRCFLQPQAASSGSSKT